MTKNEHCKQKWNMTTAVNMFLRQTIRENGIPFSLKLNTPNISILAMGERLDDKYRDHRLSGNYSNCRECHVEPDWLLIYEVVNDVLVLVCYRVGSHSELF